LVELYINVISINKLEEQPGAKFIVGTIISKDDVGFDNIANKEFGSYLNIGSL